MIVTYRPADGDQQVWEFDPDQVRASQAEMIEKRYGAKWDQWRQDIELGASKARRVLLWHLMRTGPQGHPTLRFEDVPDFIMGELVVEHSVSEVQRIIGRLSKMKMDESEREQVMAALDIALAEAYEREGLLVGEVVEEPTSGKSQAVSKLAARSTGSKSRTISTSAPASSTS